MFLSCAILPQSSIFRRDLACAIGLTAHVVAERAAADSCPHPHRSNCSNCSNCCSRLAVLVESVLAAVMEMWLALQALWESQASWAARKQVRTVLAVRQTKKARR